MRSITAKLDFAAIHDPMTLSPDPSSPKWYAVGFEHANTEFDGFRNSRKKIIIKSKKKPSVTIEDHRYDILENALKIAEMRNISKDFGLFTGAYVTVYYDEEYEACAVRPFLVLHGVEIMSYTAESNVKRVLFSGSD